MTEYKDGGIWSQSSLKREDYLNDKEGTYYQCHICRIDSGEKFPFKNFPDKE